LLYALQKRTDPASIDRPVRILGRYPLRGSIDLVECESGSNHLRVTDHKTGKAVDQSLVHIGGGRHLQPVLYALAAREVTDRPVLSGRLAYCTRRGGYSVRTVHVDDEATEAITTLYESLDDAFERGFFPAAPAEGSCRYCDYRRICGPLEEQRTRVKQADALAQLHTLRDRP
ncbi:MAG: PD-(D/E)XK nuclease family protein, partial [Myxococcota bacterium]